MRVYPSLPSPPDSGRIRIRLVSTHPYPPSSVLQRTTYTYSFARPSLDLLASVYCSHVSSSLLILILSLVAIDNDTYYYCLALMCSPSTTIRYVYVYFSFLSASSHSSIPCDRYTTRYNSILHLNTIPVPSHSRARWGIQP
ncbi:hypothetical protein C8F04DRAFT_1142932 [Mycena alexandri]|uniref:Uncharacterized protein n=1 Tax=Mycena alexandri TaxID=1745969 RepID=A0AAD6WN86_9AGAR|nr:hypothetical protein C8F04DRAFT_1142932 [Mycena alexandri]